MRAGVFRTAALSVCLLLWAVSAGHAQSSLPQPLAAQPLPGFVPPYEVAKIVREAGYEPLTRPRREGSTYVVRATNHRGILMRVVIDARSGAIRAVNRIVPGPGPYGVMGMMPPPYGDPYGPAGRPNAGWSAAWRYAASVCGRPIRSGVRAAPLSAGLSAAALSAGLQ